MRRFFLYAGLLFGLVLCVGAAQQKPVIKIGAVIPVSGNNSYVGEVARDALLMRLDEQRAVADSSYEYDLKIEDDGYELKRMAMAVQKLKNIDKVDTVITFWGTGSEVAVPLLKGSKVLHMSCDRWLAKEFDYPYDFTYGSHQDLYAAAALRVFDKLNVKRVAIFGSNATGLHAFLKSFDKQVAQTDIEVVAKTVVNLNQRDFRTWILKMQEAKPDILMIASDMPVGEIVLKQMRELECPVPHIGVSAIYLSVDRQYAKGHVTVLPAPATGDFAERFQKRYGYYPRYPAGQFYDTLDLLIKSYEATPGDSKPAVDAVCRRLREIGSHYVGTLGPTQYIAPNRFDSPATYYLMQADGMRAIDLDEVAEIYREMLK